jgi:6-phosphogluconolactonase
MRRLTTYSAALLLLFACSSDNNNSNGGSSNNGGSSGRGGTGGNRTGGSSGSTGGTTGSGGASSGGSTGSGGTTGSGGSGSGGSAPDGGGDVAAETGGGDMGGTAPLSGTTYIFAAANVSWGMPSNVTTIKLDHATGTLTKLTSIAALNNAAYGAISSDKKFFYLVTEQEPANLITFNIGAAGALTKNTELKLPLNHGEYIGVHPNGKWLAIPYYLPTQVTVHPIDTAGKVGAASDTKPAATPAAMMAECHQSIFDKAGANLFVTCKKTGTDTIAQFKFANGMLTANTPPTITVAGGVRHLAFSKDEKFAYGVTEGDNSVVTFSYDKAAGKLTMLEKVPAFVDEKAKGTGSHILIHNSGKFLFVGSRADNAILTFSIDQTTGKVTKASTTTDGLSWNRNFDIEPTGNFLIAGNQPNDGMKLPANKKDGGDVVAFRIDQADGKLTKVGTPVKVEAAIWYIGTMSGE